MTSLSFMIRYCRTAGLASPPALPVSWRCERAFKSSPFMGLEFSPVFSSLPALPGHAPGGSARLSPMLVPLAGGIGTVVKLEELMMVLELIGKD